ncbi:MAG: hypothetical protein A2W85_02220 [Bacteroidetes bacterium GWF2_41_31]|jgi:predicted RNase H-like HicB family nuclease|nr:MAG: hypothetical protein A2W85_02220 [Bacteroidetes bacterium GWF2_41_31]OFZ08590.1 MAG: hypothetical protein A2338_06470 [Bacteroidetes bacterium RIFOXYB12_FULL_41_6]
MKKEKYIFWQDEDMFIGYLEEFPDYWTQGITIDELKVNLRALYIDLTSGHIPQVRKVDELEIA